ncbi:MAG: GNAT family N-acetyltransferase [Phycisphaerae bacterium]|nr:GNAT family N-acetyltransferase [Phycisphaerae bacterium]
MIPIDIAPDDPREPDVVHLIQAHLAHARAWSKPEDVHVLESEALVAGGVEFFSAREQGRLLAIGALSPVGEGLSEIKSMHTALEARRRGIGRAMLEHLVDIAVLRDQVCVALETGLGEAFAPARALYRSRGFRPCPPFGIHRVSDDSICMSLAIGT